LYPCWSAYFTKPCSGIEEGGHRSDLDENDEDKVQKEEGTVVQTRKKGGAGGGANEERRDRTEEK